MKKLFFVVFMLAAFMLNAQKSSVLYSFDFSGGLPSGWAADSHSSNWFVYNSANAGGTVPELMFYWNPSFNAESKMVSDVYDVSAYSTIILSFKQALSDYSGGYTIGVKTSSDGGNTWNTVWSQSVSGDIDPETKTLVIDNSDVGANFQFCFFFSGNSYNLNNWWIDDVELIGVSNLDMSLISLNNNRYDVVGDKYFDISLINFGNTTVTSFDANYQVDGGSVVTENVTGVNLATGDGYDYTFSQAWTATAGDHNVKIWISNVNGTDDDNQGNDTIEDVMHIGSQKVQRTVLYEEFTSSTCNPCATFNTNYFNTNFLNNNAGKYALVKYQMSWPSPGDPYYTDEGGVRRAYYSISGVPTLMIDAEEGTHFNTTDLQTDLDNHYADSTLIELNAVYNIDSPNVYISGTIIPHVNVTDFTLQIAIVEGTTTGNTGSNGETEFHNVMMKMVPDAEGSSVNLTDGTPYNFNFTQDMTGTNVEEYSDLQVILFIQNDATKEVFQSTNAVLNNSVIVSFYPADNAVNVPIDTTLHIDFSGAVRFLDDSEIVDSLIGNFIALKDSDNNDVPFTATIDSLKQHIVITPDNNLAYNSTYSMIFTGSSIEDVNNTPLTDSTITFTTEAEPNALNEISVNVKVYPVPVDNFVNIVSPANSNIQITDVNGRTIRSLTTVNDLTTVDVSDLNAGLYLVKVNYQGKQKITKFLKK